MLTDQIEIGESRANIKTPDTESDPEPGFLLEWDQKITNDADGATLGNDYFFVNINGQVPFAYKGPKPKDLNKVPNDAARQYINNYMQTASNAMLNCKNNNDYLNYINVETFYDYFIAAEYAKNVDAAYHSSIFLTKPKGEKLQMGPLWDYDLTFGYEYRCFDPTGWYLKYSNPWYSSLITNNKTFRLGLKDRWNEVKHFIRDGLLNNIDVQSQAIYDEAVRNHQHWGELNQRIWPFDDNGPNPGEPCFDTYDGYIDQLKDWAEKRYVWMDEAINTWSETNSN